MPDDRPNAVNLRPGPLPDSRRPAGGKTKPGEQGGLWELARTIFFAFLIAVGIRSIAFEPFNIPSSSMVPTLLIGDYLFVAKYSYGYSRYSFPLGLHLFDGRVLGQAPERGDVIVFKLPRDDSVDYIKRLIGLPGDRIQMRAGRLYINDALVERAAAGDYEYQDAGGGPIHAHRFIETLPGGRQHPILEFSDTGPLDSTDVYTVPPGHYFMMGDNRDNSLDSRVPPEQGGVGYVPSDNLVGRAEFRFFSLDETTSWWEIWKWPVSVRISRMFQGVT